MSSHIEKPEFDNNGLNSDEKEEEEFEFSLVSVEPDVTADEIFHNGQIKPLYYPLFDTALLEEPPRKRTPLGKLFREETRWSCSSSEEEEEEDELERVPTESYCLWNPNQGDTRRVVTVGKMGSKKSNSMGGSVSKRWKLKDMLLRRSNSVASTTTRRIHNSNNEKN